MASGWSPGRLDKEQIEDGDSYHRALYHGGDLNSPAGWHRDSVEKLIDLAMPNISDGSLVVDYGCGTGGSAIELMKVLDERGISVELVLIDPLESWFAKAWEILGHRDDVHFELSVSFDDLGNLFFRELDEMLNGRKADVIISSSTLHLIPVRALDGLAKQFSDSLVPRGVFIWDSGDIECDFRPADSARLHDPYRAVRELLRDDEHRKEALSKMESKEVIRAERRIDRIFPTPFSIEEILDSLSLVDFSSELSDRVVEFSNNDAQRFILVPRLAEIAAPMIVGEEREEAIKRAISETLSDMRQDGTASDNGYRSHWVYGLHRKG